MADRDFELRYVGDRDGQGRYMPGVGKGDMTRDRIKAVADDRGETYAETKRWLVSTGVWEPWEQEARTEAAATRAAARGSKSKGKRKASKGTSAAKTSAEESPPPAPPAVTPPAEGPPTPGPNVVAGTEEPSAGTLPAWAPRAD